VASIRDLEQGRVVRPRPESVRRLADALGLDVRDWEDPSGTGERNDPGTARQKGGRGPEGDGHSPAGRSGLWVGICGPLAIRQDGAEPPALPAGQRAVVGLLALAAGSAVLPGSIIGALWPEQDPPPTAASIVQTYVSRLRSRFQAEGERLIARDSRGYRLCLPTEQLDLLAFRRLAGLARQADDGGRACDLFEQAMRVWRGDPVEDIGVLRTHPAAVALAGERLAVALEYADRAKAAGRNDMVLPHIKTLAATNPLDERLHAALMIALAGGGRQAEALRVYDGVCRRLGEELGMDPGVPLRDAHRKVLRQEITLASPTDASADLAQPAEGGPGRVVPRELPAPVAGFSGRVAELAALTGLLDRPAGQAPEAVVISAIGGTAGVGKTALAVQWAHQVADRFPGGQLYVNLRGYDPDQPVPAADALARFLRSLGLPGQDIPPGEDERAARYRSLLAGKKMLIVLDNAASVEQVRPLLPGTAGCAVVVTSRDALAGLVARHGAARLELALLPPTEAAGLLRTLVGARVDDDPDAAAELAAQCCRLPLALRVAAELAAARPDVPLAELVGELADQSRRLDLLDAGGDPRTSVRAVFSWSYRHLDPDTAGAFRLAGLHPGADFEAYAAAALTDSGLGQARKVLDTLARGHLVQPGELGRYGMHDLLRAYARELAARDGEEEQDTALTRLFDYYLHTAATVMDTLYPAERHRRPRIPPPDTPIPPVTEPGAARAWLDAERATLVAVTVHAAGHGWPTHATRLSDTLFRYLDHGGHHPEAITIHSHARAAAQHTGDRSGEAHALNCLGTVYRGQGNCQQAADHLRQAAALFKQVGDHAAQAAALHNLGLAHHCLGRYRDAIDLHRQALSLFRETGDPFGTAYALDNLGNSEGRQGRYDLAARHHRQALAIAADIGARNLEGGVLVNLGTVGLRQRRYRQAAGHLYRALALSLETGFREAEAEALASIGDLCLQQGRPDEAARHLREALALYREIGWRSGEADTLNSLGEVLTATGQPDDARAEFAAALGLAAQTGDKYQQARAYRGIGQACHADGDPSGARRHMQQALGLFSELGTPEADQIRAEMATVNHDQHPDHRATAPPAARQMQPGPVDRTE
jgi:tetratricopeptide (TPR) repeat protein/DNA-binding SARP family transcriptional activator